MKYFWLLLAPDSPPGGGGGDPKNSGGGLTEDRVNEIVNGALKKGLGQISKSVTAALTGEDSPLMTAIKGIGTRVEAIEKNPQDKTKKKSDDSSDKSDDPKYQELRERMEQQEKTNKELQDRLKKTADADKARKQDNLKQSQQAQIQKILDESGFKDRAKFITLDHLGKIEFEDADPESGKIGNPLIDDGKGNKISYNEFVAKHYINSEEGKSMLPSTGRSGSGSSGSQTFPAQSTQLTPDKVQSMTDEEILKMMPVQ